MVTRSDLRTAGVAALLTGGLLAVSLAMFQGGPPSSHPNAVLAWNAENAPMLKASAVTWLLAMLGLVGFAIGFREAMWATVLDRSWMTVLFVQGAGIFATVAVVSAAVGWALADQAAAGTIDAELAGMVWSVELALLRFASWGLTAPLIVVGAALAHHSTLGQISAVAAVLVAAALLVPLTWGVGLYAFAAWLGLAGVTLLVPRPARTREPAPVA